MTDGTSSPPQSNPIQSYPPENLPVFKPKNNLTKIAKIISGVVVIALLGTGVTLATQTWDPLWNPFRPEPEKVIEKMTKKMGEVKTLHTDLDLKMDVKIETPLTKSSETNIKMLMSSESDNTDPENLKSAIILDVGYATEGMEFSFAMEAKVIGEKPYVKITTIPALVQMFGIDPNEIKNKWFILDEESLAKITGEELPPKEETKKKEEEMTQKFKKLLANKKLYFVKEELPDERIGEIKTYHYVVSLDKEEIKKIMPEMMKIFGEGSSLAMTEDWSKFQQEFDKFLEKIGELNGDLWVGKKDKFIYRFKGEKTFDLGDPSKNMKTEFAVKIDIDLSKFNQQVEIKAPETFKKIEEILPPGLFSPLPGAEAPTSE